MQDTFCMEHRTVTITKNGKVIVRELKFSGGLNADGCFQLMGVCGKFYTLAADSPEMEQIVAA